MNKANSLKNKANHEMSQANHIMNKAIHSLNEANFLANKANHIMPESKCFAQFGRGWGAINPSYLEKLAVTPERVSLGQLARHLRDEAGILQQIGQQRRRQRRR